MHRYVRWLLNTHYRPLVTAQHLARYDIMRSLSNQQQTSNLSVGLKQVPVVKGTQWFFKKFNFSFAANQSFRPYMEDRMCYLHEPQNNNLSMYSIFDGHGGHQVADFLEDCFNKRIVRMLEEKEERYGQDIYVDDALIEQALADEVERIDGDLSFSRISTGFMGSTLISALIHHNRFLTIINVGDSRAIASDTKDNCVVLSSDHKPHHPEERERIEQAGGFVEYYGVERVQGILAVSRAFGDTELKRHQFVISTPEIRRIDLAKEPLRYLILASDGFWDVVSSHEAILEVNYLLEREERIKEKEEVKNDLVKESEEVEKLSEEQLTKETEKLKIESEEVKKVDPIQEVSTEKPHQRRQKAQKSLDSPTRKTAELAVFQAKSPLQSRPQKVEEKVVEKELKEEKKVEEDPVEQQLNRKLSIVVDKEDPNLTQSLQNPSPSTTSTNSRRESDSSLDSINPSSQSTKPKQIDIAAHLVKLALKRRSPDNISVFFVRLDKF